jgi:CO/xanthine dehydrogenase Mo-binding subunit
MSKNTAVGQRIPRVDAIEKVTGQAMYGDDLAFQNVLYAKAVRSPHAHARILNIDTSKAQKLFGVKAIAVGKELPVLGGEALKDYPFLAVDRYGTWGIRKVGRRSMRGSSRRWA